MLTHHRRPVSLSLISTDLPILSTLETAATLYQKDSQCFHLLLHQPQIPQASELESATIDSKQLLWLEISPYRVILTLQGNSQFSYRHFWEKGIYGVSRYWLNSTEESPRQGIRLRNFTRNLKLEGKKLPEYLRVEYELWTGKVQLGHYVLHLEIYH